MTGRHGLNQVESFAATYFTDYDSIGSHAKSGPEKIANRDGASAADVWRLRLQLYDMTQLNLKLLRIFDDHKPFVIRGKRCEGV
jgi:hypothetical protein